MFDNVCLAISLAVGYEIWCRTEFGRAAYIDDVRYVSALYRLEGKRLRREREIN